MCSVPICVYVYIYKHICMLYIFAFTGCSSSGKSNKPLPGVKIKDYLLSYIGISSYSF